MLPIDEDPRSRIKDTAAAVQARKTRMIFIYNILFPMGFVLFVPSIIIKLIKRGGSKRTFLERFSIYGAEKARMLREFRGSVWIHSVSVGESQIALSFIRKWLSRNPGMKFVISTTTTTAQAIVRENLPQNTVPIFCPIDFPICVKRLFGIIQPSALVIFETELWPNIIREASARGIPSALVNARMSDKSFPGYRRFSFFFSRIIGMLKLVSVQTELDRQRFLEVCPASNPVVAGNMKFDQAVPESQDGPSSLEEYFGRSVSCVLMGASTHPGEEKLLASIYKEIRARNEGLRLLLVPRHTERKAEIEAELQGLGIDFRTRTGKYPDGKEFECLLVDTTGEMFRFMAFADIVVMGKSFAGHDEGHNLVEPALLEKPIITGSTLKNFKFLLKLLMDEKALITVDRDEELAGKVLGLVENPVLRRELGRRARAAVAKHGGATAKNIAMIEEILKK